MICPNGHEVLPGVRFCKTCGAAVHDKIPGPAKSSPLETPAPPSAAAISSPEERSMGASVTNSAPESSVEEAKEPSARTRTAHRIRQGAVVALASLSLVGVGVVVGWFALGTHSGTSDDEPEIIEVPVAQYLAADGDSEAVMPDVRGLAEDDARAVLADAGISDEIVSVEDQPSAGPVGVVVSQEPAFGSDQIEAVVLAVSVEVAVPDVTGQTATEAQAALTALGTRVAVERRYVAGTDPGLAIATEPEAGSSLPESVTLLVSEAPGSAYLDQLDTTDDSPSCYSDEAVVNGQQYANSLECSAEGEVQEYVWLLGRKVETFEALIGVPDDGNQDAQVDVTVLADGAPITRGTAAFGQPLQVETSVSGAIQLQIRLRATSVDPDSFDDVPLILANARLIGSTSAIAELAGWGAS